MRYRQKARFTPDLGLIAPGAACLEKLTRFNEHPPTDRQAHAYRRKMVAARAVWRHFIAGRMQDEIAEERDGLSIQRFFATLTELRCEC